MFDAIHENNEAKALQILSNDKFVKEELNLKSDGYMTAPLLHLASQHEMGDLVNAIISHKDFDGELLNCQDSDGNTPLHYITMKKLEESLSPIINHPNFNSIALQNKDGRTAFHCSCISNNEYICKTLHNHAQVGTFCNIKGTSFFIVN